MKALTDFNDLAQTAGLEAVSKQIGAAMYKEPTEGSTYGEPVPLDHSTPPVFPRGMFPSWLDEMARAISAFTETPIELPMMFGLAVLGACCQKKFMVQPREGYLEPVNIWPVVALDPGNRKTAVMQNMIEPIKAWEAARIEEARERIMRLESERKTQDARIQSLRAQAAKAKEPDFSNIKKEIADIEAALPDVPHLPRLWAQDITPEKLGQVMADQGEQLTILSDEGGLFDMMAGRYNGGLPNLDIYLQSHAGSPVRVDRGSRSAIFMQNPALTIGLSPQPDVLRSLSDKPGFRGRGLLARFCYTLPVSKVGKRTLNGPPVPKGIKDLYRENMISLLNIVAPENNAGDSTSFILKLSADALREWTEFAQAVEKDIGDGGRLEFIKDWGSKLSGTAIRIAGLMHCAHYAKGQPWQQPISQTTMEQALTLAAILAEHALIVFDLMGADEGLSAARKVWRWIERQRLETFTARDCFQALKGTFARMGNLRPAFDVLIERHYIFPLEKEQSGPGRPSEVFYINPKIVGGWS